LAAAGEIADDQGGVESEESGGDELGRFGRRRPGGSEQFAQVPGLPKQQEPARGQPQGADDGGADGDRARRAAKEIEGPGFLAAAAPARC